MCPQPAPKLEPINRPYQESRRDKRPWHRSTSSSLRLTRSERECDTCQNATGSLTRLWIYPEPGARIVGLDLEERAQGVWEAGCEAEGSLGAKRMLDSVGRKAVSFSALIDHYCTTPGRMKSVVASMARDTRVWPTGRGLLGHCAYC
jgi:hypothetical protein